MNVIKDFVIVNKIAIKGVINNIKKAPHVLLVGLLFYSATMLIYLLLSMLLLVGIPSIIASLLMFFVEIYIGVIFLRSIEGIVEYSRFKLSDIKSYARDRMLASKIAMLIVLGNILSLLISMLLPGNLTIAFSLLSIVVVAVLFNPLPEVLYQKNYDPVGSLKYTANFMVDNWITWLLPTALVTFLYNFVLGFRDMFSMHLNIFQITPFVSQVLYRNIEMGRWIEFLLLSILLFVFMLYRGHLFKLLSETNRRSRSFNYYNED